MSKRMWPHKSIVRGAHLVLDAPPGDGRPAKDVAADLGFTERQAARLGNIFDQTVPPDAERYLREVSELSGSSMRAFVVVSAALDLRSRRQEHRDAGLELSTVPLTPDEKGTTMPAIAKEDRLYDDLERQLEAAKVSGRCEDWEIDEVSPTGGNTFGVKVGIYPWGKTIIYGTAAELRKMVGDILTEIATDRFKCPFCAAVQPLDITSHQRASCECGTEFFVRHSWQSGAGILGEDCWPPLRWKLLHAGKVYRSASQAVAAIESGNGSPEDLFNNVVETTVYDTVVYAVGEGAGPKERSDVPMEIRLADLIVEAGFQQKSSTSMDYGVTTVHRWYEGVVSGEQVVVATEGEYHDVGDYSVELTVAIDEEPSRIYDGAEHETQDIQFAISDEVAEAWCSLGPFQEGAWQVWDGLIGIFDHYQLSAVYSGAVPANPTVEWLQTVVEEGVAACVQVADNFADLFDVAKRISELEAESEATAAWKEHLRKNELEQIVSGDDRLSTLLAEYVATVGDYQVRGWNEKDQVDVALSGLASRHPIADIKPLTQGKIARALWSNRLRKAIASQWQSRETSPAPPS